MISFIENSRKDKGIYSDRSLIAWGLTGGITNGQEKMIIFITFIWQVMASCMCVKLHTLMLLFVESSFKKTIVNFIGDFIPLERHTHLR